MRVLFPLVLTVLFFTPQHKLQAQSTRFFSDAILIKYEDESTLQVIHAKQGVSTKQKVDQILSQFDSHNIEPVWKDGYTNQLSRTIAVKSKTVTATDLTKDLKRIYRITFSETINPEMLARKLSSIPGVEYAEPHYIRRIHTVPNDDYINKYQTYHNFNDAWDISTGSTSVVIAIIDGGVNYHHEDLDGKNWVNSNEAPDNGIDDDGNGYVDDYYGWDFWQSGYTYAAIQQDNTPIAEYSYHGTHVAGIAAAETGNGLGISGTGYNTLYMPIKVGGVEDDPETDDDESDMIGFGYDGILYATAMGADVINCSFGGPDYSATEAYIVKFATDFGALVVASSGNSATDLPSYPAAYTGVLSVGSVETSDMLASYSNYGYSVDVLATGSSIYSAAGYTNDGYGASTGTSMSAPVVAGLAGLIKAEHADWSARRIGAQIRATSNRINTNSYLYGNGAIDAAAALTNSMPGVEISSYSISGVDGAPLKLGSEGSVSLTLKNYGLSTTNLIVSISSEQDDISISTGSVTNIGAFATNDSTTLSFDFTLPSTFNLNSTPVFILTFEDASLSYSDFGPIQVDALNYGVMEANSIRMSFSGDGTIGYSEPNEGAGGIGFLPGDFGNVLYEAGIILTANNSLVTSSVRNDNDFDRDFDALDIFGISSPGVVASQDGTGEFSSNTDSDLDNLDILLNTYAFDEDGIDKVVFSEYQISNNSTEDWTDFYFGVFADWDVNNYENNSVDYDASNNLLYVYDNTEGTNFPYMAIVPLQQTSANLAIDNAYEGTETSAKFNLYDGYTDQEKLNSMTAGNANTSVSNTDISEVVASGPYVLGKNNTISLGFLYAYGETLAELQNQVIAARAKSVFAVDEPGTYTANETESELPLVTNLHQNYPNPFNPTTELSFDLSEAGFAELTVYNINGQKIKTLISGALTAGAHSVYFDASTLASGVYLAVLKTPSTSKTIKLTLLK